MPELERQGLTLITEDLRVQLPVLDLRFPEWREMWPSSARLQPVAGVRFGTEDLGRFARFKDAGGSVSFTFHGGQALTIVEINSNPPVTGLLRPRRGLPATVTPDGDPLDDEVDEVEPTLLGAMA